MRESLKPRGEALRGAARRIAARRAEEPDTPMIQIITEAARHFDLSPSEEQMLLSDLLPGSAEAPQP
ncbi:DUSAM domain-containing protein [Corallococcus exiguus]